MHLHSVRHNRLQRVLPKIVMFLVSETLMAHLGLDDMLDMGEWVEERRGVVVGAQIVQIQ